MKGLVTRNTHVQYESPIPSDKKVMATVSFSKAGQTSRSRSTGHVLVKHGCPRRQQSRNMSKISKSYILTLPHPQGHVMSVKCEKPIELTVQVWLLYHHLNIKYCIFVCKRDGITDRRTIQLLDAPGGPFRPGA